MTRIPYERYEIEDPHGDTETGPLVLGSAVALVIALIGEKLVWQWEAAISQDETDGGKW